MQGPKDLVVYLILEQKHNVGFSLYNHVRLWNFFFFVIDCFLHKIFLQKEHSVKM